MATQTDNIPILIISYFFPPRGGVGVQRIAKIVKYLPQNGFTPIVLTVRKPEGSVPLDENLMREIPNDVEIIRTRSFEPYHLYRALGGRKKQDDPSFRGELVSEGSKKGFLSKLYFEYQRRYLIPDPKIGWLPPAVAASDAIFKKHSPKLILSTSPEATAHLIALKLHSKYGIPFVADFRDPWIDGFYSMNRPKEVAEREKKMEQDVLESASLVTTVMQSNIDRFERNHPGLNKEKFKIIPNGFDETDYTGIIPGTFQKFTIAHTGSVYFQRSPEPFFKAISLFLENHPNARNDFQILFQGRVDESFLKTASELGIRDLITIEEFGPHKDSLAIQLGAHALLILSEGMMTAKVYEYLRARKPVIGFSPQGELDKQISEWGIGKIFTPDAIPQSAAFLGILYDNYKKGLNPVWPDFKEVPLDQYERSRQVAYLASLMKHLLDLTP
jgi:hypothetical protein